jgi:putative transposase
VVLTAQIKLLATPEQANRLRETMIACNAACDYISEIAWRSNTFRQFDLHRLCYVETRRRFALSAQAAVRCISKVADAYKLDHHTQRTFRGLGAVTYDDRILSFSASAVSIWTLDGRIKIPFVCGNRQTKLLATRKGESDLTFTRDSWFLMASCATAEPAIEEPWNFLGVDLGVANIASDSDGRLYSGSEVKSVRHRQRRLRKKLQRKVTTSANRRLKKLAGKEARFARHTNHVISKQIVATAEGTGRGIKLEQLSGIRDRITVRHGQRVVLHSWAFLQLKNFVLYKAALAGVLVVQVDPRNSSRECSQCGHIDKANRPSQSKFSCQRCGHTAHADLNAACVIAGRAECKPAIRGSRLSVDRPAKLSAFSR